MKKEYKILAILFLLALIIRIVFLFASPVKIWDETVYANLGYDLSKNPFDYSFAKNWSDFVPGDWPKAGYRAPLLPYTLSIFYFLNLNPLIEFLMPLIGALSAVLVFILARKMFNEKVALYSSIFLTFLPLHIIFSAKILTDVFSTFFIILAALFFWQGFEKNKNKYKLFFGVFLGLSVLSRYAILFIIPIFPLYLIIKHKNIQFLKDRFLWISIILFFIVLSPWFFYGVSQYGNPLGPFIHGFKAASYWGGVQPWYFFFQYSMQMFSVLSIIFLTSIVFIVFNKKTRKNLAVLFLLLWFFIFFISASIMPHKEDRFVIPLVPPFVILSALTIDHIKKYEKNILIFLIIILIFSIGFQFVQIHLNSYNQTNLCFLESTKFLQTTQNNSVIITDESSIVYYYSKRETHFYPNPFSLYNLKNLVDNYYKDRPVYILFIGTKDQQIKEILNSNFEIISRCPKNGDSSIIYKYK